MSEIDKLANLAWENKLLPDTISYPVFEANPIIVCCPIHGEQDSYYTITATNNTFCGECVWRLVDKMLQDNGIKPLQPTKQPGE